MLLGVAVPLVMAMRISFMQKLAWSVGCGGGGIFIMIAIVLRIYYVTVGMDEKVILWALVGKFVSDLYTLHHSNQSSESATLFLVVNAPGVSFDTWAKRGKPEI